MAAPLCPNKVHEMLAIDWSGPWTASAMRCSRKVANRMCLVEAAESLERNLSSGLNGQDCKLYY